MKKMLVLSILLSLVVLWAVSCGGGGSAAPGVSPTAPSNSNPAPQPQSPPQPQAVPSATVTIVGSSGSGAFSPNPVQVADTGTIVLKNESSVSHVLVMNDGSAIGTVAPGASLSSAVRGNSGFHCLTHPSMVGTINGPSAPPSPGGGDYTY